MMAPLVKTERLVKEYSRPAQIQGAFGGIRSLMTTRRVTTRAVDDVSFSIDAGEIVGYLGPNGAGKSTTIKMLTGILVPTSGVVEVNGLVPWRDRKRNARSIGVVFGQRSQLWYDLPLRDSFELISQLYGMQKSEYQRSLARFVDLLDMGSFLETPVRLLSLGQRMRGDLTAAMLYEPPLLYLDEPTVGLDVVAKARIREFIDETNRTTGTTVMLTTHDLSDVERLCERVLLIDGGQLLYDGTLSRLRRRYVPYRDLVVRLAGVENAVDLAGANVVSEGWDDRGRVVVFRFDPEITTTPEVVAAVTNAHEVLDLSILEPDLEGVIAEIYTSGSVRVDKS